MFLLKVIWLFTLQPTYYFYLIIAINEGVSSEIVCPHHTCEFWLFLRPKKIFSRPILMVHIIINLHAFIKSSKIISKCVAKVVESKQTSFLTICEWNNPPRDLKVILFRCWCLLFSCFAKRKICVVKKEHTYHHFICEMLLPGS